MGSTAPVPGAPLPRPLALHARPQEEVVGESVMPSPTVPVARAVTVTMPLLPLVLALAVTPVLSCSVVLSLMACAIFVASCAFEACWLTDQ